MIKSIFKLCHILTKMRINKKDRNNIKVYINSLLFPTYTRMRKKVFLLYLSYWKNQKYFKQLNFKTYDKRKIACEQSHIISKRWTFIRRYIKEKSLQFISMKRGYLPKEILSNNTGKRWNNKNDDDFQFSLLHFCLEVFFMFQILWTALSVALGLELKGEYIRGVPCIKRNQQLYCPTAGNSYPL